MGKALCAEFPSYLHVVPGSKLGLKFKSGIACELAKRSVVTISKLKDAVGARKLQKLEGGRWAYIGAPDEELPDAEQTIGRIRVGTIAKVVESGLLLVSDAGVERWASVRGFFQAVKDGSLFIVYLPKASCEALSVEYQDMPHLGLFQTPSPSGGEPRPDGPVAKRPRLEAMVALGA